MYKTCMSQENNLNYEVPKKLQITGIVSFNLIQYLIHCYEKNMILSFIHTDAEHLGNLARIKTE